VIACAFAVAFAVTFTVYFAVGLARCTACALTLTLCELRTCAVALHSGCGFGASVVAVAAIGGHWTRDKEQAGKQEHPSQDYVLPGIHRHSPV
jgi:hypothetical protein